MMVPSVHRIRNTSIPFALLMTLLCGAAWARQTQNGAAQTSDSREASRSDDAEARLARLQELARQGVQPQDDDRNQKKQQEERDRQAEEKLRREEARKKVGSPGTELEFAL